MKELTFPKEGKMKEMLASLDTQLTKKNRKRRKIHIKSRPEFR